MFQLEKRHRDIVLDILKKYPYTFYAYGSRVKGTARKYSNLDICYYDDIPSFILVQIEKDLEQLDLPFMIELVNWKSMRLVFQKAVQKDLTLTNPSKKFPILF